MYNVLIIGKDSYIGESLKVWLEKFPGSYYVAIVSSMNHEWKKVDYSKFNVVVNLAGVAHINNITEEMRDLFYSVNRDLSIKIATHVKNCGIRHYVYFSSMNVYGDYCENITDKNNTNPTSFYGDSKLQGDIGIQNLVDECFSVAVMRPPFVYGKGCKGNYKSISMIAKKTPIFPTYKNKKSMIYIDNLCEFIRLVIETKASGIFMPQNKELVSTAELVKEIAEANNHKVCFIGIFNWAIGIGIKLVRLVRRAFANDCYELSLSDNFNFEYCVVSFKDSIIITEK